MTVVLLCRWSEDLRQQFLIKLYLYLPELSSWVKDTDSLVDLTFTAKAKHGKVRISVNDHQL